MLVIYGGVYVALCTVCLKPKNDIKTLIEKHRVIRKIQKKDLNLSNDLILRFPPFYIFFIGCVFVGLNIYGSFRLSLPAAEQYAVYAICFIASCISLYFARKTQCLLTYHSYTRLRYVKDISITLEDGKEISDILELENKGDYVLIKWKTIVGDNEHIEEIETLATNIKYISKKYKENDYYYEGSDIEARENIERKIDTKVRIMGDISNTEQTDENEKSIEEK